ncbi:aminopeptidase, partial [Enterococcus faecium]
MTDFAALLQPDRGQPARTIHVVRPEEYGGWLATQSARVRTAVVAARVTGKAGNRAILPGESPDDWSMLLLCDEALDSPW